MTGLGTNVTARSGRRSVAVVVECPASGCGERHLHRLPEDHGGSVRRQPACHRITAYVIQVVLVHAAEPVAVVA